MLKFATIVVLLFLGATSARLSTEEERIREMAEKASTRYKSLNTLNYGEECSYKERQQKDILKGQMNEWYFKNADLEVPDAEFLKEGERLINLSKGLNGPYCQENLNLECSPKGVCECASGDILPGMSIHSIRQENSCRLTVASNCLPPELLANHDPSIKYDMLCESGTTCMNLEEDEPCTRENFEVETTQDGVKSPCQCF